MAKIIKQVSGENKEELKVKGKIYQFGIQAPSGSIIIFNEDRHNKVIMGNTGIFQADLDEGSYITSIQVEPNGLGIKCYIDVILEESLGE